MLLVALSYTCAHALFTRVSYPLLVDPLYIVNLLHLCFQIPSKYVSCSGSSVSSSLLSDGNKVAHVIGLLPLA